MLRVLTLALALAFCACILIVGCSCSSGTTTDDDGQLDVNDVMSTHEGDDVEEDEDAQEHQQSTSEDADDETADSSTKDADSSKKTAGANGLKTSDPIESYDAMCNEYEAEYGEATCDDSSSYASLTGLCFAQLFDFDDDGTDELIIAYESDDAEDLQEDGATADEDMPSPHYAVEVWRNGTDSVDCVYRGAALMNSEGAEVVAWGSSSQYGGYIMSGQLGLGGTQYYYDIEKDGSSQFAKVTVNDDDEVLVNGEETSDDDWLKSTDDNECVLAGYGMTDECEKTLEAFAATQETLKDEAAQ